MKYCKNGRQNFEPNEKFSIGWVLINCLWIIGGSFYILYFVLKEKICPMFKRDNFEHMRSGDKNNYEHMVNRMKAERKSEKERIALINAMKSYAKTKAKTVY
ncbi:hypothetical protein LGK95_19380 [Clostridium algoriphilum]|uniref:hypothetical protein n=1 Tax=Clostridium algoriphilum TaxID=198347 RepID=UPI001CF30132|nr:hypothetical protein [Clostridium algoriphilum]MCB2295643.1 hypothetical protein [Clostridium algoriphilum]